MDLTTVNGQIAGTAIGDTCVTGKNETGAPNNQAFQDDCNLIVGGATTDSPDASAQALTDLAADQINAQNSAAGRATRVSVALVQNRLERIRIAGGSPTYQPGAALAANSLFRGQTGGAASGDVAFGRFGGFLNADYVTGDEDTTDFQPGYDYDAWSVVGGIDYRFADNFFGGLSLRYADGDVDFDSNRGSMSGDAWGLSAYGSYFLPSGLFFDGLIGYGVSDYTLKRRIQYSIDGIDANQTAKSDPDADLWNFNLGAGYTINREAWSFTPELRINYLQNKLDGYSERMSDPKGVGGSMGLAIDSQTYESLTSNLGIQIARAISHAHGVIVPQLRLGWIHEFKNDQESVGARFVNDINNTPLFVLTNKPDRDYIDLAIGVSAQFAQGKSGFISYNTLLDYDGVSYNAFSAGVRVEF
ncbi:MAG: autotransporter outer membrane beta-barrel domain-containing protein [Pseudomonadota bacterium]|nr:autotransporter outer membrane beta-barrel domain-containing protein [Pseudomonadota bacterium]